MVWDDGCWLRLDVAGASAVVVVVWLRNQIDIRKQITRVGGVGPFEAHDGGCENDAACRVYERV